ncbi:Exopolyphosphatase [Ceratobasidium sp. 423]|nr:Exopolyphosphatase [Ceratobasidium sp. 423]
MIDTGGLEDNSKTTTGGENKDCMTMSELANVLVDKKRDVSELSGHDLLRRDYKEFEWNNSQGAFVRVGLSTVPMGLKHWIERDGKNKFWAAQDAWIKECQLDVSGVFTMFRTRTKNKHKREMLLVFPQTEEVADAPTGLELKLYTGIESNSELGAEQKDIPGIEGRRARAWEQTEKQATRKQIAPAFKAIIEAS